MGGMSCSRACIGRASGPATSSGMTVPMQLGMGHDGSNALEHDGSASDCALGHDGSRAPGHDGPILKQYSEHDGSVVLLFPFQISLMGPLPADPRCPAIGCRV